jgi:hypothetical protein
VGSCVQRPRFAAQAFEDFVLGVTIEVRWDHLRKARVGPKNDPPWACVHSNNLVLVVEPVRSLPLLRAPYKVHLPDWHFDHFSAVESAYQGIKDRLANLFGFAHREPSVTNHLVYPVGKATGFTARLCGRGHRFVCLKELFGFEPHIQAVLKRKYPAAFPPERNLAFLEQAIYPCRTLADIGRGRGYRDCS